MALNISESQFVLPGSGSSPAEGLNALSQRLFMRNIQSQRLDLAKEQKREQAGNFLKDYLNPEHYLSGSEYDPVITGKLQAAMAKGAQMAEGGADAPALLQALGPDVADINQYTTKAKVIGKQIDDTISKMRENKMEGYNYGTLKANALKAAFHVQDPKTGQDMGLNPNISAVDPGTNWVEKLIQDNPGSVTTSGDIAAYAKETPINKTLSDVKLYSPQGTLNETKAHLISQSYSVPEVDKNGVTTGLVPAYDHANDSGKELMHTFTGSDGKPVQAPIRLLDENLFDDMLRRKPGAADYIKGQVQQHLNEDNTGSVQPITMNSPQAKLVARAIAYDELKRATGSTIEDTGITNKPSAAQVQLRVFGDKYQQSYDRTQGRDDAESDDGTLPASKSKVNTIQALTNVFNNDPVYNSGPGHIMGDGRHVVDITSSLPKAMLKFGHAAGQAYKNVYHDVANNSLILDKGDGSTPQEVPASGAQAFASHIAEANGVPLQSVQKIMGNAGFVNGKFTKAAPGDALQQKIMAGAAAQYNADASSGVDQLIAKGKGTGLKNLVSPDGTITAAGKNRAFWNKDYFITSKDTKGAETTKNFNTKEEMMNYLSKTAAAPAAKTAPVPAAKKQQTDQDLINQYK